MSLKKSFSHEFPRISTNIQNITEETMLAKW